MNWAFTAYFIFAALLITFCVLSISESKASLRITELGTESIAPQNLRTLPRTFELNLQSEAPSFPIEEMTTSQSWINLQDKVAAYAERLEVMGAQNRIRQERISYCTLVSSFGMIAFAMLLAYTFAMRRKRANAAR